MNQLEKAYQLVLERQRKKEYFGLCIKCNERPTCRKLCSKAKKYVLQNWGDDKENQGKFKTVVSKARYKQFILDKQVEP